MDLLTELAILVLAAFVGFEVISRVPNTLHTPLMSATNAIHGIVVLGGLLLIGPAHGFFEDLVLVIAIVFAAIIGSISFWGSIIAFLKLQESLKGRFPIPKALNGVLAAIAVITAIVLAAGTDSEPLFWLRSEEHTS